MGAPAESLAVLEHVRTGGEVPAGVLRIPPSHSVFVGRFMGLRPEYGPPPNAVCLGSRDEPDRYDVVRCRYRIGSWGFEYDLSSAMSLVRIRCPDVSGKPLEIARSVAARVFGPDEGVVLELVTVDGGMSFGRHDVELTGTRWRSDGLGDWYMANWRDVLKWWQEDRTVGFVAPQKWGREKQVVSVGGVRDWFHAEEEDASS